MLGPLFRKHTGLLKVRKKGRVGIRKLRVISGDHKNWDDSSLPLDVQVKGNVHLKLKIVLLCVCFYAVFDAAG